MLDADGLATAQMESDPYRWAYLRDAIVPAAAEALRASFPERGFWRLRQHDGEKPMDFRLRPVIVLGEGVVAEPEGLSPEWLRLAHELLAPSYRQAVSQATGIPLDDALLEVSAWRWGADAHLGVHADIPRKIVSQVFYFNEAWDCAWGGCLRILRSREDDDCIAELPPALGSASLLVRSDDSWHSVAPLRRGTGERWSLVATWQYGDSESPFFTVRDDGSVVCHTRGASRIPERG